MKILALETSAITASVAICEDEKLLGQCFQNSGLTHSVTLMPMVTQLLDNVGLTLHDMDMVAVAVGPGSFTGVRIGVAAAKGLAWPEGKPCAPCSTLESMAWQCAHMEGEICAVMDARRSQVYAARFLAHDGTLTRLSEDAAIGLDQLAEELEKSDNPKFLVGDGAALCYNLLREREISVQVMPPHLVYQTAWGVARAGLELARNDQLVSGAALAPQYHRLSQAERERLAQGKSLTK